MQPSVGLRTIAVVSWAPVTIRVAAYVRLIQRKANTGAPIA